MSRNTCGHVQCFGGRFGVRKIHKTMFERRQRDALRLLELHARSGFLSALVQKIVEHAEENTSS